MANLYDLKKFDLNLLVIFECIYQHLSISKAAESLFITPSAVSQSLQRLRTQLNDPLFIRAGKGITPTTIAVNLHHHLDNNLNQIEKTLQLMSRTDLARKFIVYAPQLIILDPVKNLFNIFEQEPNLLIEHHDMLIAQQSAEDLLNYRKADLVITTTPSTNLSVVCQPLQSFRLIPICRRAHPRLKETVTLEQLLSESTVSYVVDDPILKSIQVDSHPYFQERKVSFRSSSVFALMNMISNSDLVGFLPDLVYEYFKDFLQLKALLSPVPSPTVTLYMIYNRTSLNNTSFADFISRISIL